MKNKTLIKKKLGYFTVLEDQVNQANLANQVKQENWAGKFHLKKNSNKHHILHWLFADFTFSTYKFKVCCVCRVCYKHVMA